MRSYLEEEHASVYCAMQTHSSLDPYQVRHHLSPTLGGNGERGRGHLETEPMLEGGQQEDQSMAGGCEGTVRGGISGTTTKTGGLLGSSVVLLRLAVQMPKVVRPMRLQSQLSLRPLINKEVNVTPGKGGCVADCQLSEQRHNATSANHDERM